MQECRQRPVFASLTLAFALKLRKKQGKNLSQGSRRVLVPITKTPTQFSPSVTHITLIHYVIKLWYNQFKKTTSVNTKNLQCVRSIEGNYWRDILTQSVHCKCWASFGLNFINFFRKKYHNKQKWMLQNIRGTENGCHPGLVFATTVHLKLEENEYLSELVLLTKQYSTLQRLYIDVLYMSNLRL